MSFLRFWEKKHRRIKERVRMMAKKINLRKVAQLLHIEDSNSFSLVDKIVLKKEPLTFSKRNY